MWGVFGVLWIKFFIRGSRDIITVSRIFGEKLREVFEEENGIVFNYSKKELKLKWRKIKFKVYVNKCNG